jgi:fatty-acyl-CoA synthase
MPNYFYRQMVLNAQHHPDKTAMAFHHSKGCQRVSRGQLIADIEARAQTLKAVPAGALVFIISATDYPGIVDYLACIRVGAIPAFIAPLTPRQDAQIHAQELDALVQIFSPSYIVRGGEWEQKVDPSVGTVFQVANQVGFLQFSSGTTRLKKGVFISDEKLVKQLTALGGALQITEQDRIASWLPLYHDMGLISTFFLPLYFGITVDYLDPVAWSYKPNLLLELIQREGSTLCWQPNFAFGHLLNYYRNSGQAAPDISSLRQIVNCSEVCKHATFKNFESFFENHGLQPGVLQCSYAMAENVFAVTQSQFRGGVDNMPTHQGILSSGQVLSGIQIRLGEQENGVGEIQIYAETLFEGYCFDETNRFTEDGWYKTGDLGSIVDQHLFVAGRVDDIVIINGKKIQAHYVEALVSECSYAKPGRVLVTANAEGSGLVVYYEGETLPAKEQMALRLQVNSTSSVAVDRFVLLQPNTLIKSSSGKIARQKSIQKLKDYAIQTGDCR